MLRAAKQLKGCLIRAEDGPMGRMGGVYFDDESWGVRYLVVDTGGLLPAEKVLILPDSVEGISEAMPASVRVDLTRQQVEKSPPVEADRPVAAQQEADYYAYHGAASYWGPGRPPGGGYPGRRSRCTRARTLMRKRGRRNAGIRTSEAQRRSAATPSAAGTGPSATSRTSSWTTATGRSGT